MGPPSSTAGAGAPLLLLLEASPFFPPPPEEEEEEEDEGPFLPMGQAVVVWCMVWCVYEGWIDGMDQRLGVAACHRSIDSTNRSINRFNPLTIGAFT